MRRPCSGLYESSLSSGTALGSTSRSMMRRPVRSSTRMSVPPASTRAASPFSAMAATASPREPGATYSNSRKGHLLSPHGPALDAGSIIPTDAPTRHPAGRVVILSLPKGLPLSLSKGHSRP